LSYPSHSLLPASVGRHQRSTCPRLMASFGEALFPLIEAAIRVLYLGVMGWIASTVTAKGITMLLQAKLLDKTSLTKSHKTP
ncbi:hypothetical protein KAS24_00670, partial [Candidatus Bathyarchaeota archaeon]|nr:hypothetical protein [Candidatus Bathyarchaeota archaeon]